MLVNLVPEFLAVLAAPDPRAAYHDYLERHRPVLQSYWRNYVLDPTSPHAERVIAAALRAERADLERLLEDVDVAAIADEALGRSLEQFEADCPVDLYLMVGVGAANAGELVVGGRGIAFVCLEHFTGRANPQTYGMGLAPHLLPLWIAHEVAHAVRYTSPSSRADLRRLVADLRGYYDYWDTGSRASLRELLVNEGVAGAEGGAARQRTAGGGAGRFTGPHARLRATREGHAARRARLRATAPRMAGGRGVAGGHRRAAAGIGVTAPSAARWDTRSRAA